MGRGASVEAPSLPAAAPAQPGSVGAWWPGAGMAPCGQPGGAQAPWGRHCNCPIAPPPSTRIAAPLRADAQVHRASGGLGSIGQPLNGAVFQDTSELPVVLWKHGHESVGTAELVTSAQHGGTPPAVTWLGLGRGQQTSSPSVC